MDYQTDINEIISFINEALPEEAADYRNCLDRFTTDINEQFLQERADYIKTQIEINKELQGAFTRLAVFCRGKEKQCDQCVVRKYCKKTGKEKG